jgi:protein-disulfide isomerase
MSIGVVGKGPLYILLKKRAAPCTVICTMNTQQKTTYITLGVIALCVTGLITLARFGGGVQVSAEDAAKPSYETDRVRGKKDALVSVIEYADFQCPACAATEPLMEALIEKYKDRVGFIFRHFPLAGHDEAYRASLYAEAAGKQGKFFELGRVLYAKQSEWGDMNVRLDEKIDTYATTVGLNIDQLRADMERPDVRGPIDMGLAYGTALKIPGTPTILVQGVIVTSTPRTVEAFSALLDAALAQAEHGASVRSSAPAYASIAVFANGKRVSLSAIPKNDMADIAFADDAGEVLARRTYGSTLLDVFTAPHGLTDTCVTISGTAYCAKTGGLVELYVNGLRRTGSPAAYVPQAGDSILLSVASPSNAAVIKEVQSVPALPCAFGGQCVE